MEVVELVSVLPVQCQQLRQIPCVAQVASELPRIEWSHLRPRAAGRRCTAVGRRHPWYGTSIRAAAGAAVAAESEATAHAHVGLCVRRRAPPCRSRGLALGCDCHDATVSISPGFPHTHADDRGYGCDCATQHARLGRSTPLRARALDEHTARIACTTCPRFSCHPSFVIRFRGRLLNKVCLHTSESAKGKEAPAPVATPPLPRCLHRVRRSLWTTGAV